MNFTTVWIAINVLMALAAAFFVLYADNKKTLGKHRRLLELIPSGLSTWGVLGTFIGISIGLYNFDTKEIDTSIEVLLEGMKTAFFTSLAGMGTSLILQSLISRLSDKTERLSDISIASGKIVDAMEMMKQSFVEQASKQDQNQLNFYKIAAPLIKTMDENLKSVKNDIAHNAEAIKSIGTYLGDIKDAMTGMVNGQNEIIDEVKGLEVKLHDEVLDIEDQMTKTNSLLREKFDEFSELLKKSNTEALVEVMKGVTAEFEKQMNELISRLVQENFKKLNESVEKLNVWQVENKEMIQSLTYQYKQMAEQFEGTSTTLSVVGEDTKNLVSEGGKLKQIITALNAVMVQDEKFQQITQNLTLAAESAKDANEEFRNNAQDLSRWILKQKDFVESVDVLMKKLEEINKINDYSEKFWAETRRGMNDSVRTLKSGSQELQQQIAGLDQAFYGRLSATLSELDNLIVSFLNNNRR